MHENYFYDREYKELEDKGVKNIEAALLLRSHMSDLSEFFYCAGWSSSISSELWQAITCGEMDYLSKTDISVLRWLYNAAGGWWDDNKVFIEKNEWLRRIGKI